MKRLIFNADDLGASSKVNDGIFKCADAGIVKSASLLVTTPIAKVTYDQAKEHGISVGLHLNATGDGPFISKKEILGKQGKINYAFKNRIELDERDIRVVFDEFRLQFDLFVKLFKARPDHLNHHHPLYWIPNFTKPFINFLTEYNLPTRLFDGLSDSRIKTPDFTEFGFYDKESLTLVNLIKLIDAAPNGLCEFVLHPGLKDLNSLSSYNSEREDQLRIITDPTLFKYINKKGYQIATFNDC